MTHEEFLNDITARANGMNVLSYSDFYKMLKIIEKLKEQRRKMYFPADVWDAGGQLIYDKELDDIVAVK